VKKLLGGRPALQVRPPETSHGVVEQIHAAVALLIRIQKALVSNLYQDIGYLD
jgi:hypothetical protein